MKIVFEGPKGVGKTTAIRQLLQNENHKNDNVIHSTKNTENTLNWYKQLNLNKENIIFDRYSIGEIVYPLVEKREMRMSFNDVKESLDCVNYIIIMYSSDPNILINRVENRDGVLSDVDKKIIINSNELFKNFSEYYKKEYLHNYQTFVASLDINSINFNSSKKISDFLNSFIL